MNLSVVWDLSVKFLFAQSMREVRLCIPVLLVFFNPVYFPKGMVGIFFKLNGVYLQTTG